MPSVRLTISVTPVAKPAGANPVAYLRRLKNIDGTEVRPAVINADLVTEYLNLPAGTYIMESTLVDDNNNACGSMHPHTFEMPETLEGGETMNVPSGVTVEFF